MNRDEYLAAQKRHYDHCLEVSASKSADYATEQDPFQNFRLAAELANLPVWKLMLSRMSEKLVRFRNVMEKLDAGGDFDVKDEPPEKTLEDLVVYPNLLWVHLEEKRKKELCEEVLASPMITYRVSDLGFISYGSEGEKTDPDPVPVVTHMSDCQCMCCILERQTKTGECS